MTTRFSQQTVFAAGLTLLALAAFSVVAVRDSQGKPPRKPTPSSARKADPDAAPSPPADAPKTVATETAEVEQATFGAGCFWCSEAVFQQLKGVRSVVSGYSGGVLPNPTYEQVCSGVTGHAEVVQLSFDPKVISYDELLEVFWQTHDPTTPNQQGPDIGTQYRSAVFYHTDEQRELAEHYKKELDAAHAFRKPIVTEISEFSEFYPAEVYHQDYYDLHRGEAYCSAVIRPKVGKLKKVFKDKLKTPGAKPHSR